MPSPAALIAGPGAVTAAKHLAVRAATSPSVKSATLFSVLFYWSFKKLPEWVKRDISFKNLLKNHEKITEEEFVGLFSVVEKLQKMASNIKDLDTDIPQLHAALLAYIQLSGQNKFHQLNYHRSRRKNKVHTTINDQSDDESLDSVTRDYLYESAGKELDLSSLRSSEIQHGIQMALYSYYEDPKKLSQKLNANEYSLLHHKLVDIRPGRVAHYIAVSPTRRQVVVALRGTSTLGDLVTDCCGHAVPLVDDHTTGDKVRVEIKAAVPNIITVASQEGNMEIISGHERIVFEDHDDDGDNHIRCHEGILISARNVLEEIESTLLPWIDCGFNVVLCGHSLGAGTAVLAATLLRSKYPHLFLKPGQIHVYAYGTPPVLDHDSAIAACSYCTSVVNNSDLISRLNISNLAVSLACLRNIQTKLSESKMSPTGPRTSVAFLNKISQGTAGTPLMTFSELDESIREAHDNLALRKPEHLFVPGRVLLAYDPWIEHSEVDDNSSIVPKKWKCVETSGTSPVFQRLEIDGLRCFTDHVATAYFDVLGMEYDF